MDAEGFIRLAYNAGGNDIRYSTTSPEECAEMCRNDENCNGFVFDYAGTSSYSCYTKRLIVGVGPCLTGVYTYVKIGKVVANVWFHYFFNMINTS